MDEYGNEWTVSVTFIPEKASGKIDIKIPVPKDTGATRLVMGTHLKKASEKNNGILKRLVEGNMLQVIDKEF